MNKLFAIAAILSVIGSPAMASGSGSHASGADLGAAVSGKTVQGNMKGSGNYTEYYAPDGTIKGNNYTGKWRVNDSDQLCVTYGPDPESCWHGRVEGNNVTWLRDGNEDGMGTLSDGDAGGFRDDDHSRR